MTWIQLFAEILKLWNCFRVISDPAVATGLLMLRLSFSQTAGDRCMSKRWSVKAVFDCSSVMIHYMKESRGGVPRMQKSLSLPLKIFFCQKFLIFKSLNTEVSAWLTEILPFRIIQLHFSQFTSNINDMCGKRCMFEGDLGGGGDREG